MSRKKIIVIVLVTLLAPSLGGCVPLLGEWFLWTTLPRGDADQVPRAR